MDGVDLNVRAGENLWLPWNQWGGQVDDDSHLNGYHRFGSRHYSPIGKGLLGGQRLSRNRRSGTSHKSRTFILDDVPESWSLCGIVLSSWDKAEFLRLLELFDIPAGRRVSQLSGGMRAKLALAMAIAPHPEILILDEPTAGLDPVARRDFMEIIVAQARQKEAYDFFLIAPHR